MHIKIGLFHYTDNSEIFTDAVSLHRKKLKNYTSDVATDYACTGIAIVCLPPVVWGWHLGLLRWRLISGDQELSISGQEQTTGSEPTLTDMWDKNPCLWVQGLRDKKQTGRPATVVPSSGAAFQGPPEDPGQPNWYNTTKIKGYRSRESKTCERLQKPQLPHNKMKSVVYYNSGHSPREFTILRSY